MKKYILFALLFVLTTAGVKGQASFSSLQYTVAFPTGDLKDFVDKTSWRGVNFDYRKGISDKVSAGFSIGYQLFYEERKNATVEQGTITLHGDQFRYVNSCPVTANLAYNFAPGEAISPYVGLGVGTLFRETELDMGLYMVSDDSWHFALRPEAGVLFEPQPGVGLLLNVKYMNAFKTEDMDAANFISLNLGVAWTWY